MSPFLAGLLATYRAADAKYFSLDADTAPLATLTDARDEWRSAALAVAQVLDAETQASTVQP